MTVVDCRSHASDMLTFHAHVSGVFRYSVTSEVALTWIECTAQHACLWYCAFVQFAPQHIYCKRNVWSNICKLNLHVYIYYYENIHLHINQLLVDVTQSVAYETDVPMYRLLAHVCVMLCAVVTASDYVIASNFVTRARASYRVLCRWATSRLYSRSRPHLTILLNLCAVALERGFVRKLCGFVVTTTPQITAEFICGTLWSHFSKFAPWRTLAEIGSRTAVRAQTAAAQCQKPEGTEQCAPNRPCTNTIRKHCVARISGIHCEGGTARVVWTFTSRKAATTRYAKFEWQMF